MHEERPTHQKPERMFTVNEAAAQLGFPRWKLYRAIKNGLVPYHTLLNSRRLVRLSEVEAAIQQNLNLNDQKEGVQ